MGQSRRNSGGNNFSYSDKIDMPDAFHDGIEDMKVQSDGTTAVGSATTTNQGPWPREVLKRFRMIFRAVQQHSHWVESRAGVSSAQLWVLWELAQKPGLRVTELARAMAVHQSTASNLLEKLAKKGLVRRERISEDQRVVNLYLTDIGRETLMRIPKPAQGILQHALLSLPEETLFSIARDLDVLIAEMNIKDDRGALEPIGIAKDS
ncbi:MAG: MarR family transcriptional regulator [Proteobacteria bacterium]|nr:MarR family transcriptional regulator [Pseudomonadota bacterium]